MNGLRVAAPVEVLHGGGVALACARNGEIRAEEQHGLFAGDTRVLSTYRIALAGRSWHMLGRQRSGHGTARWQFENPAVREGGDQYDAGTILLDMRRRVDGAMHDDLRLCTYCSLRARLTVQIDADFADVLEVKQQSVRPRLATARTPSPGGLSLVYQRSGFRRGLHVSVTSPSAPSLVGSLLVFELDLGPGQEWTCCVDAVPDIDGERLAFAGDPHTEEASPTGPIRIEVVADDLLQRPFARGCADLVALAMPRQPHPPVVAAGVPWFLALFGRDSLLTSLMAGLAGVWSAEGALAAVGALQATERDDWRDAEPGKLPHELRCGELAHLGLIPHTPYYGTHDAAALYCLALWNAWRWTGDRQLLDRHLDVALRALRWCTDLGDRDGDGLQEYGTRSRAGYYNQGWKDAGDAIVDDDGRLASLPLATVELQGYLYAARLAVAELLTAVGATDEAAQQQAAAAAIRSVVEDRYWCDERGSYALAVDGNKQRVMSTASNPGHLLWAGLPSPDRAERVARRLLDPDMSTGWGIRTLSALHPAYNPLSYQRGSVWPHDSALAAAGMRRYGLHHEAAEVLRGLLEAARAFEDDRLPELYCGFDRSLGLPVPYREANVPQAWAAATPVLAAQVLLGIVPDAPAGRCYVDPWLPDWLPALEVRGLPIGSGDIDLAVVRAGPTAVIDRARSTGIEIVEGSVAAPLWGTPELD